MTKIMCCRYTYTSKDQYITCSVCDPRQVVSGLWMATFKRVKNGLRHYCISSEENGVWFEVDTFFPLIKLYDEMKSEGEKNDNK